MRAYRDQYASVFNGGRDVVLIAISADPAEELAAWAADEDFPFLFAADPNAEAGRRYGAYRSLGDGRYIDNRTVFVIDPEGTITKVMAPFREVDPTAYEELAAEVDRLAPPEVAEGE